MNVTEKNTKAEILKAYESLLKNVQDEKANIPKQVQEEKMKKETLDQVSGISTNSIMKNITELKTSLNNSLDELHRNLVDEFKKLEEIRSAIIIEKQLLEDIYSLKANTDSLATMLLVQREKKESFEKEIAEKTAQWEQEKAKQKLEEKEYNDELAKRRKREEDEFQYALRIARQKEKDTYETSKNELEKELANKKASFELEVANREKELKVAEAELHELRKSNAEFPAKMEKAVAEKEAEVAKKFKTQYDFDFKLMEKQNETEIKLKDQLIASLQEKIQELQIQVKEYNDKAVRAESGVKDIAMKAIESAAKSKTIERIESSAKE